MNTKKHCLLWQDRFGVSHLQLIQYLQGSIYKRSGSGHFTTRELKTSSGHHKPRQVLKVSTNRWSIRCLRISTGNVKHLQNVTSSNRKQALCPYNDIHLLNRCSATLTGKDKQVPTRMSPESYISDPQVRKLRGSG